MSDFIEDYLRTLNEGITNKVDQEFQELKQRVQKIDDSLLNLENEIDAQFKEVNESIDVRQAQTSKELNQANNLLINVKQSHKLQHQDLRDRQESIIKEV